MTLKIHKIYFYFAIKHARDFKFGMFFPCVAFNKFGIAISTLTILWPKTLNIQYGRDFLAIEIKIFKMLRWICGWNATQGRCIPNLQSEWMYVYEFSVPQITIKKI